MRTLDIVNRCCYGLCLMSIVVGATTAILGIWTDSGNDLAWKGFGTASVMFGAGLLTIVVNNVVGARVVGEGPDARGGWLGRRLPAGDADPEKPDA
jgi:hypothetical protein